MLHKPLMLLVIGLLLVGAEEISRKGAKAQREFNASFAPLRLCGINGLPAQSRDLSVEVFQVLDLPLSIHEASLVKSYKNFYLLKLSAGNSSDLKLIGLRYALITIDSKNQPQPVTNRTEGFSLSPYDTKTLTFKAPINFKPKDGERFVLMVEQVVSRESIWEVVKAKDALEAYAKGDFSVTPVVMRVSNSVDAPPGEPQPAIRKN
jgi:hypothetical protein